MKNQLRYERIPKERLEDVWNFVKTEFLPDEPVMRSIGFVEVLKGKWSEKLALQFFETSLTHGLMAVNEEDELMGVMTGFVREKGKGDWQPNLTWCTKVHPSWIVPKVMKSWGWWQVLCERTHYESDKMFKELGHDRLFDGDTLCVAKAARGMGVGGELVKRSVQLAREEKCGAYYVLCTGMGSQTIFRRMDFDVLHEVEYGEIKKRSGKLVVWDHREHRACKNMAKQL